MNDKTFEDPHNIDRWWATYNAALTGILCAPEEHGWGGEPRDGPWDAFVHYQAFMHAAYAHGGVPVGVTIPEEHDSSCKNCDHQALNHEDDIANSGLRTHCNIHECTCSMFEPK